MTLKQIFGLGLINNNTKVWLRGHKGATIAFGRWYQKEILDQVNTVARSFSWQDNDTVSVDFDLEVLGKDNIEPLERSKSV